MDDDPCMSPEAAWFEGIGGVLYIVPPLAVVCENAGPDDATMDELNTICRSGRMPDGSDAARLGLDEVPHFLRRCTGEERYFHA